MTYKLPVESLELSRDDFEEVLEHVVRAVRLWYVVVSESAQNGDSSWRT